MRSLVVTTWYPDTASPSRTPFCLEHVRAIQSAGHHVRVVHLKLGHSLGGRVEETYEQTEVTRVSINLRRPWTLLRATSVIADGLRQSDVLHTMAFSSILLTLTAWLRVRRPWLHTEHWNGVIEPASVAGLWPRVAVLRHALRFPHVVTGVTTQLTTAMTAFARPGATVTVPCVVEPVSTPAPFPPRPPLRLVGVGLLIERKRPILAVETIAWLARNTDLHVRYTWVGDGPLLAEVRAHADRLGVGDIVALPGAVPPGDVHAHLADAHLFFVPSSQENFFTAIAEAITAGRPAVAPLSGGFNDYCNPDNSVLVSAWDVETLGRAIVVAAERFARVPPSQIAATLDGRFSRRAIGKQFSCLYERLVG